MDPDKKGLIAKLKQEQRKSRPPPKKRGGKAGGVGDWGPGRRKGRGGKRGRREEGGGGGHDYNFRANYPRTIMSEDYDYENEQVSFYQVEFFIFFSFNIIIYLFAFYGKMT